MLFPHQASCVTQLNMYCTTINKVLIRLDEMDEIDQIAWFLVSNEVELSLEESMNGRCHSFSLGWIKQQVFWQTFSLFNHLCCPSGIPQQNLISEIKWILFKVSSYILRVFHVVQRGQGVADMRDIQKEMVYTGTHLCRTSETGWKGLRGQCSSFPACSSGRALGGAVDSTLPGSPFSWARSRTGTRSASKQHMENRLKLLHQIFVEEQKYNSKLKYD